MSAQWYYVQNGERKGPESEGALIEAIKSGVLKADDYVWRKGLENWQRIQGLDELSSHLLPEPAAPTPSVEPSPADLNSATPNIHNNFSFIDFNNIDREEGRFYVLVGLTEGASGTQYGPFSLDMVSRLYKERRIDGKTYLWTKGMSTWELLAELPIYQELFQEEPPVIEDTERRSSPRRPFVARIFIHDNKDLYEGVCRDISVGGMQILVSNFPGQMGEKVSINVHPENSDYHFTASGVIVRLLEGKQGFSFRFSQISDEAKRAIESYIKQE